MNIDHLFVGRQSDNLADMRAKGRGAAGMDLAQRIAAGWTPELKVYRAAQTGERMRAEREAKRVAAGASPDDKFCPTCAQWLDRGAFYKNAARPDGLKPHCKPCFAAKESHRMKSKRMGAR